MDLPPVMRLMVEKMYENQPKLSFETVIAHSSSSRPASVAHSSRRGRHSIVRPITLPMTRETGQNGPMDEITIRPARPGDARGIARLDVETWRATYAGLLATSYLVGLSERRREAGWRSVILREPRDVRVAVDSAGAIVGFGSCGPNRTDRFFAGEVFTLYVAPDWQNQGVGRRLLITLFRRLVATGRRSAILWVLRDNPSRFFYERLGGQQVSRKALAVAGTAIEATAYGWRDLPGFLAAVSSEDREPEA
jgi:ribosomal protein S18 acetylase RimI-like enzyme